MINTRRIKKIIIVLAYIIMFISNISLGSEELYNSYSDSKNNSSNLSSSYDYDEYSRDSKRILEGEDIGTWIFILMIFVMVITFFVIFRVFKFKYNKKLKYKDNYNGYSNTYRKVNNAYYNGIKNGRQEYKKMFEGSGVLENQVEMQIKKMDETFNKEEFLSWTKTVFTKFQHAWTERNFEIIKTLETGELFEKHKLQLQEYVDNNTINVIDKISIKTVTLHEFVQDFGQDVLTIKLNSRMNDYIIDATTKEIIKGNQYTEREGIYYLTFLRKNGDRWLLSKVERI